MKKLIAIATTALLQGTSATIAQEMTDHSVDAKVHAVPHGQGPTTGKYCLSLTNNPLTGC